jgi:hypothetical protein
MVLRERPYAGFRTVVTASLVQPTRNALGHHSESLVASDRKEVVCPAKSETCR